jgi:polar amino acid transport system permease protein
MVLSGPRDPTYPEPAIPKGSRGSRLLGDPEQGRRGVIVSLISTLLVLAIVGYVVVNLPTWPRVQDSFFNAEVAGRTAPKIVAAFGRNVVLFLLAEVFVLVLGLVIAVMRSLKEPVFTPGWTDSIPARYTSET